MPEATSSFSTRTSSASRIPAEAGAISRPPLFGLTAKIFLSAALVVIAVLGGALLLTQERANRAADASISRALIATQSAIQDALASRSAALSQSAQVIAQVPDYVARIGEALRRGNRANLLDQANEIRDQVGAAWALITNADGILQARTDRPGEAGDSLGEGALVGLALAEGRPTEGAWIEPGPEGEDEIYQAVGIPITSPGGGALYAVLVVAVPVDDAFSAHLKTNTNSDVVFFVLDTLAHPQPLIATLPLDAVTATMAGAGDWDAALQDTAALRVRWDVGGEILVGVAGPLNTAAGFPVGGYVGLRSRNVELAAFLELRRTIVQVFLAGLVLAVLSSLVVARQIAKPVRRLVEATRRVAEGQFSGTIGIASRDEIGELARAFQKMQQELKEKQDLVEFLSGGGGATVALTAAEAAGVTGGGPGGTRVVERPAVTAQLGVGQVLAGRYEIKKVLGAGGMGVVYRAYDRQLDEVVAVKTLKPEAVAADTNSLERFKQEIRLARKITHRNVVRTHDLGEVDGMYYITMEYVEGANLKDLIRKRGRLPTSVTLTVGKQLCRALEVAHEAGVIHRDIKPQNIVVDAGGFLKVMDFGIARRTEGHRMGEGLTAVGAAIGTPEYMAPEQLMGEELDQRVDLYAAGAVLYECVTGRMVFSAPTVMALMAKHLEAMPDDPRAINPEVPDALAAVILKALAKHRHDRWASAVELHAALDKVGVGAAAGAGAAGTAGAIGVEA